MKRAIERVAVLGAGVMGARIAAHLANADIPCFLLDIVPSELTEEERRQNLSLSDPAVRNRVVRAGLEAAKKSRPPAFFLPELAERISVGNFEDNLDWVAKADWIIEAVVEKLDVKCALLERVERFRRPGTIVSTNTSGLPVRLVGEGRSEDFRRHWLGTHFFNPPRYMKLLEVIPTAETLPEVVASISSFCDRVLGKGVVIAKDTPNFIANRIGTFSMLTVLHRMVEEGMTIEEIDALTGPALGWPRSATFRTADLVGLDVLAHVVRNIYENAADDECRQVYRLPEFVNKMLERGWLGEKTGQGFYQRVKKDGESEILALDWKTLEYRPQQKAKFAALEMARNIDALAERLPTLVYGDDRAGRFLWSLMSEVLPYAAARIPEISDRILELDQAMCWGFNWELGPFEMWDAIGVERSVARMRAEGRSQPPLVEKLLRFGQKSFYRTLDGRTFYFNPDGNYRQLEEPSGIVILKSLKERTPQGGVIKKNPGASLIDLGDGVACVEFHAKMNAIGADIIAMLNAGLREVKENFLGMVVGNQGANFSVGANLMLLLVAAQEADWDEIDAVVRAFQNANMAMKYAAKPVVVAPFGMTLGGGCEVSLHGTRANAAAESYIGLVEAGVGLIPAGGGTKEMLLRALERAPADKDADLFPYVKTAFETIALAKTSTSAEEARRLGYLRDADTISMNRDRQLADAKQLVLALAPNYRPGTPRSDIPVLGETALATLKLGIHLMRRAEFATEYDAVVAGKLAHILTGGALTGRQTVSEQYLLDLEREAFVSLCGQRKTQERIQFTLKTGKPLRN